MRRLDTPARKSEDLPASIAVSALRGTGVTKPDPWSSLALRVSLPVKNGIVVSRPFIVQDRDVELRQSGQTGSSVRLRSDPSHEYRENSVAMGTGEPIVAKPPLDIEKEERSVRTIRVAGKRLLIGFCSGGFLIAVALHGCGGSSEPIEIPEAAKKSLLQKKLDYEHRSTKSPRTGPSKSKGPTGTPRP